MSDDEYRAPDEAFKAAADADAAAGVTHSHRSALRMALDAAGPYILNDERQRIAAAIASMPIRRPWGAEQVRAKAVRLAITGGKP